MEERSYSTLGRHGLASSYSYLDGVPFRIGPNFKQPSKVVAPPELAVSYASTLLKEEYSFETEEAVLAWARAREEALKKAAKEQAEKQKQAEELAENEQESDEENEENSQSEDVNGQTTYDVPRNIPVSENHVNQQPKPRVPPKPLPRQLNEPGTILKPTPIHPTVNASAAKLAEDKDSTANKAANSNARIDVSMFESEADPFDNLELQTLNDMEELKVLLDSSSTKTSGSGASAVSKSNQPQSPSAAAEAGFGAPADNSINTDGIYEMATAVKENEWETFSNGDENTTDKNGSPSSVSDNSELVGDSREYGEYVEIATDCQKQSVSFQNHSINGMNKTSKPTGLSQNTPSGGGFGGKLPASLASSKLYKPVLPPIPNTSSSTDSDDSKAFTPVSAQSTNPFIHPTVQNTRNPFLPNITQSHELASQSQKTASGVAPVEKPQPPPVASKPVLRNQQSGSTARMWSSVGPSLASSLDENGSHKPSIANPYSRHSLTGTDLHTSTSSPDLAERKSPVLTKPTTPQGPVQPWSRHRPLPPPPTSTSTTNSYTVSHLPPTKPVGLTDPYHSLSSEAQAFTDSLTSMGFLKARVARAVAKFGQDEKEVLDHLIAVDALVEKKYAPVMAETALQIYKNDMEKAEKFLQMFSQFEELGFKSEKIREALVTTNMDHDKALDILTA